MSLFIVVFSYNLYNFKFILNIFLPQIVGYISVFYVCRFGVYIIAFTIRELEAGPGN